MHEGDLNLKININIVIPEQLMDKDEDGRTTIDGWWFEERKEGGVDKLLREGCDDKII